EQYTDISYGLDANGVLDAQCDARPCRYDSYLIISAASGATGNFASITSNINNGIHGDPPFIGEATAEGYTITFDGYTGGDADGNDVVGFSDLSVLASNWGRSGMTWSDGDFDGDGTVNFPDLSILSANWGWSASQGDRMENLPELRDVDGDGDFDINDVNLILEEFHGDK
ncbi:hypothetical protein MUP01_09950, partial [Candidatus Bathyarchaeota archaeon]|nr:hypothetical protein [Candidatus Bathyarchaeota archaeon]